jgi:hypothetical protein
MSRAGTLAARYLPLVATLVAAVTISLTVWSANQAGTLGNDFAAYDSAVRRFLAGGPLYDQAFAVSGPFGLFFYPPPFALVLLPFTALSPAAAIWAWTVLMAAALVVAIAVMPVPATVRWGMLLVAAVSWPALYNVKLGQVGTLLLLLLALGWRWLDRPPRLASSIALGTLVKVQPALLFGWALVTGRARAVALGIVVIAVFVVASAAVFGPGAWLDWATLLARLSQPIDTPHSVTLGHVALDAGTSPTVAWALQIGWWVAVAGVVAFCLLRCSAVASYLAVAVASQTVSPILWDHYAVMLLLPAAWLWARGAWWAVLVPLLTSLPLIGLAPPLVYTLEYALVLVLLAWHGRERLRDQASSPVDAMLAG